MLAKAEKPLIIMSSFGKVESDVAKLEALAERFAIPVTARKPRYMGLPTNHSMHFGFNPDAYLDKADVIVVLECDVPWIPNKKAPRPDCKIIHIGADPLFNAYPMRGFACDLAITGIPGATLPALTEALAEREKAAKGRIDARRARWAVERQSQHERWKAVLEKSKNDVPLHPAWITHCLNQVK